MLNLTRDYFCNTLFLSVSLKRIVLIQAGKDFQKLNPSKDGVNIEGKWRNIVEYSIKHERTIMLTFSVFYNRRMELYENFINENKLKSK